MMGFIDQQAVAAESEAAPREEEVIPEGMVEAETGGIVLEEGPALTNETFRDWFQRWYAPKAAAEHAAARAAAARKMADEAERRARDAEDEATAAAVRAHEAKAEAQQAQTEAQQAQVAAAGLEEDLHKAQGAARAAVAELPPISTWNTRQVTDIGWLFEDEVDWRLLPPESISAWNFKLTNETLLPRTVNGTGHTGPSEFCATSI